MNILFISSVPQKQKPTKNTNGYNGGGWERELLSELLNYPNLKLGICDITNDQPKKEMVGNMTCYYIPIHRKTWKDKLLDALHPHDVQRDEVLWPHYTEQYKRIIADFKPDVIHIFGSEVYRCLAALVANCPCVLHIQGLLSLYIYSFFPPGISRREYIWKDGVRGLWHNWTYLHYWMRSVYREKIALRSAGHVIGRTNWDREAAAILAPQAKYHFGGEMMRSIFYEAGKRKCPNLLTLMTTTSSPLYKGFDLVLHVADILKNECHIDFEWNVFGNVNPKMAEKVTGLNHKDLNIHLCGVATAEQLRNQLLQSTLYFHPSYVENSPNSICEAQLLGLPIVATHVGGTDSLIQDNVTGFLFPATDPYMGASKIIQLSQNIDLNIKMGESGKQIALKRHDKKRIIQELLETYKEMIYTQNL